MKRFAFPLSFVTVLPLFALLPFGSPSAPGNPQCPDSTRPALRPAPPTRAQQDSLLRQFPFLRMLRLRDAQGRALDLYGRPVEGC